MVKYFTVSSMLPLIEKLGFQPRDLILLMSKYIKGLSPIQPLLPPEYDIFGLTCNWLQMIFIDCLTLIYSFVPRLKIFIFFF